MPTQEIAGAEDSGASLRAAVRGDEETQGGEDKDDGDHGGNARRVL